MAIWNLLTHTSGLTYSFALDHPVDALYRRAGFKLANTIDLGLAEACDASGESSRSCSSRAPSGTTASRPTSSAGSSKSSPVSHSTFSSKSASSSPLGMVDTDF